MTTQINREIAMRPELSRSPRAVLARFVRRNGSQIGIIGVFLLVWLYFVFAAPETFQSDKIYASLMMSVPLFGIVALPLTMVVIAGEMDLSFPSVMAVGMVAFAQVYPVTNSLLLAFLACLGAGFGAGLLNGLLVVRVGIPSLIATIGTQFFWRGVVNVVSQGHSETYFETRGMPLREALVGETNGFWEHEMFWMVVVGVVCWLLLNRHVFGAHIYLTGDNENSARLMGVNVDRTKIMTFALVGLAAAFAGSLSALQLSTFFPTLGQGQMMPALAAVFLGGTSVFGGTGTIIGTFVGCYVFGMIKPGLIAVGMTGYYTELVNGSVIVLALTMHTIMRRRMQ